jgi:hypothetical protein
MPAMIVPFERLSPKHDDFSTFQGLEANEEAKHKLKFEKIYDEEILK